MDRKLCGYSLVHDGMLILNVFSLSSVHSSHHHSHVFLHTQGLNWDDLAQKKVSAPFRPELKSELDVGNFAEEFTGMDPVYSPASTPPSTDKLFKVSPSAHNTS